ncbi:hypothetical protein [Streptomyces sp. NPDC058694]|uniref:hypothetical protein n=1 Tax=Streptomyces sp. NPDC058694 TaxID=3346603 RepID=UPI003659C3B6
MLHPTYRVQPSRGYSDTDQYAVAFDHAAGDQDGVHQAGMAGADDGGGRVGDREHGQVVGAQEDDVGVLTVRA